MTLLNDFARCRVVERDDHPKHLKHGKDQKVSKEGNAIEKGQIYIS